MSPPKTSHNSPKNPSIHDIWLRQRTELEEELLDIGNNGSSPLRVVAADEPSTKKISDAPSSNLSAANALPISLTQPLHLQQVTGHHPIPLQHSTDSANPPPGNVDAPVMDAEASASLANLHHSLSAATTKQFLEHQQRLDQELTRQREAFVQEINRQRAAFEQELSARDAAWTTQRDREWAALQSAKEVHAAAIQRLQSDLATERVREQEAIQHWRRQAELELAEARRLFEQDRMQQHAELTRQRDVETNRLRQERAEFEAQVRQTKAALVDARERHEHDLQLSADAHTSRLQTERTELEQQRAAWTEKFRREQLVLENGMQFFEQYVSRFSEEMKAAQHDIPSTPVSKTPQVSAEQFASTIPFASHSTTSKPSPMTVQQAPAYASNQQEADPVLLSLDEIRDRLNQIKNGKHQKVA